MFCFKFESAIRGRFAHRIDAAAFFQTLPASTFQPDNAPGLAKTSLPAYQFMGITFIISKVVITTIELAKGRKLFVISINLPKCSGGFRRYFQHMRYTDVSCWQRE